MYNSFTILQYFSLTKSYTVNCEILKRLASVYVGSIYSSTSLVRGFWDEIFWPPKPRTTEGPRTREGYTKIDIGTKF